MTEIKKGNKQFFIGEDEANAIAKVTYKDKDTSTIIVDHTYVSEELRGQGIAGKLYNTIIEYARQENKKIVPECSYIRTKMEHNKSDQDLLAK
ncbi:MAG TPA: GNAT family N-acetyltransferase [Pseudogracilibacillus sp.]|nr:GNAT family N-acetyltransferase [Pseudogracilibacillus sp.]